jgi:hypothetical protein
MNYELILVVVTLSVVLSDDDLYQLELLTAISSWLFCCFAVKLAVNLN